MSDEVRLRPITSEPIEVECVQPEKFAGLSTREIASLPVWIGRQSKQLGDFFEVSGERSSRVRIDGDVSHVEALGAGMGGGMLMVEGNAGPALGRAMRGGQIHVKGNAADGVGSPNPGASRGMIGGEIVIDGSAGADAGAYARRGLVVITGNAGFGAARGMIAGTVLICGDVASDAGVWNKRGTLVVMGTVDVGPTYRYACTYRPPIVSLILRSVSKRYGLRVNDRWVTGDYRRYSGDMAELGKGEILQWIPSDK